MVFDQFGYTRVDHGKIEVVYPWSMHEAITNRHVKQATDYAYWMGMAIGMMAGATLGLMVGLVW